MLFSSYRLDQYPDPEGFMAQVALVMSDYSEEVVNYATDPRTGIQRHHRFPPVIEEITGFLERAKGIVAGEKLIQERAALGYRWIDNPADNRVGFYNAHGQRWEDRHRQLTASKPFVVADKGRLDRALKTAVQRIDRPKVELTLDDGRHVERIKDELERRRSINAKRAEAAELTKSPNSTDVEARPDNGSGDHRQRHW